MKLKLNDVITAYSSDNLVLEYIYNRKHFSSYIKYS